MVKTIHTVCKANRVESSVLVSTTFSALLGVGQKLTDPLVVVSFGLSLIVIYVIVGVNLFITVFALLEC